MNQQDPKAAILMALLAHLENSPFLLPLDAEAVAQAIGTKMSIASTWLNDLTTAGLAVPFAVPGEPSGWSGRYVLTAVGEAEARRLRS